MTGWGGSDSVASYRTRTSGCCWWRRAMCTSWGRAAGKGDKDNNTMSQFNIRRHLKWKGSMTVRLTSCVCNAEVICDVTFSLPHFSLAHQMEPQLKGRGIQWTPISSQLACSVILCSCRYCCFTGAAFGLHSDRQVHENCVHVLQLKFTCSMVASCSSLRFSV